jgi:hypothetical protein
MIVCVVFGDSVGDTKTGIVSAVASAASAVFYLKAQIQISEEKLLIRIRRATRPEQTD